MTTREIDLAEQYYINDIYILRPELFRYIYTLCGDEETSNDVVNDVLTMAWEKVFYVHSKKDILSFLKRCARNNLIDHYRKYGRIVYVEDPVEVSSEPNADVLSLLVHKEDLDEIKNVLGRLSTLEKRIICMFYFYNESLIDISNFTRIPYNTVSTIKRRTLQKLAKMLESDRRQKAKSPNPKGPDDVLTLLAVMLSGIVICDFLFRG